MKRYPSYFYYVMFTLRSYNYNRYNFYICQSELLLCLNYKFQTESTVLQDNSRLELINTLSEL